MGPSWNLATTTAVGDTKLLHIPKLKGGRYAVKGQQPWSYSDLYLNHNSSTYLLCRLSLAI